MKINQGRLSGM